MSLNNKTIEICGLSKGDNGRSCTLRNVCGSVLKVDDCVKLKLSTVERFVSKADEKKGIKKRKVTRGENDEVVIISMETVAAMSVGFTQ